jgi:carboxypeptidase Q
MTHRLTRGALTVLLAAAGAGASEGRERVDEEVIASIRAEAFQRSAVMDTVRVLADRHGPRLGGSPEFAEAARWARDRLAALGLDNARLEPFQQEGPAWTLERFSVEMTEPRYMRVVAEPQTWSPPIEGVLRGRPVLVDIRSPAHFAAHRGKLRGAIVMNGRPGTEPRDPELPSGRYTDEDLARRAAQTDPGARGFGPFTPRSYRLSREAAAKRRAAAQEMRDFFVTEQVAALITPSRVPELLVTADSASARLATTRFPAFVMATEHYGRIARLLENGVPVTLALALEARFHAEAIGVNVLAEIPGTDPRLKDELVMLGAHLDSVHSGTGATDDAAGCAVMMEAVRILKAIGAHPRRTIRIALWGSEELGHLGSRAYVKRHFGDPDTLALKPDHGRLSAYFNLDNGSGRIRGVYLQGNEAVRPIFEEYLRPFHYLGAATLTILNTGGTDHEDFDAVGLPGFQFIQDAHDYETRVSHSSLDVYESVHEEDLKQAAAVVAGFVHHTAIRDERLPRKPLPSPEPRGEPQPTGGRP